LGNSSKAIVTGIKNLVLGNWYCSWVVDKAGDYVEGSTDSVGDYLSGLIP
jgi:hypothetical protein